MNSFQIFILLLNFFINAAQQCSCKQIQSESDCLQTNGVCIWDGYQKQCVQTADTYLTYCGQFSLKNCPKLRPCEDCGSFGACQWVDGKCSHFTGCSAHKKASKEECQSINEKCISNGFQCIEIGTCSSYLTEVACQQDLNKKWCVWNITAKRCDLPQTCDKLPKNINTDSECRFQNSKCMLNIDGGCIVSGNTCEDIKLQQQCYYDVMMKQCIWKDSQCISNNEEQKLCQQYLEQSQCTQDYKGQICFWNGTSCDDIRCQNASNSLTTNVACSNFLKGCITTSGGGCVDNNDCSAANLEEVCIEDKKGNKCFWDVIWCKQKRCFNAPISYKTQEDCDKLLNNQCLSKVEGGCREKECQDFYGSSHSICKLQRSDCTLGQNGKCAKLQNCENTTVRSACIEGLNGPCIWIQSEDGTSNGNCYSYTSCKSLKWTTDSKCKQISPQCTTDGQKCVAITNCQETNTNGGCVTGNDGICFQNPKTPSNPNPTCLLFNSCFDIKLLSLYECQQVNKHCGSDEKNGCIPLSECEAYKTPQACQINYKYRTCTWNMTVCYERDNCTDHKYNTHVSCYGLNLGCTTDGQACVRQQECSNYTLEQICSQGQGTNGQCFWDKTKNSCRLKECFDLQFPTSSQCNKQLSKCLSDGTTCIEINTCASYKTQVACSFGGKDGKCAWGQNGPCVLMKSCSNANYDKDACNFIKEKCQWEISNEKSICSEHNCYTNQVQNGICQNFYSWHISKLIYCKDIQATCTQVDPTTFQQQDCFKQTNYTYTWNTKSSKCEKCSQIILNDTNPDENPIIDDDTDEDEVDDQDEDETGNDGKNQQSNSNIINLSRKLLVLIVWIF